MRKIIVGICAFLLILYCAVPVIATEGNITYSDDAGKIVFAPGSEYSPTDLFPNFKDVMPGDSITQTITLKNDASNQVKVKIYMRAKGAHQDSEEFLSQMNLRVEKSEDNTMAYMFDAAANERGQLFEWVCLGTLYSGGEVNLNVILDVPAELDNKFQQEIGFLDWEFMIEELAVEDADPQPPITGDAFAPWLWVGLMLMGLCAFVILFAAWKQGEE